MRGDAGATALGKWRWCNAQRRLIELAPSHSAGRIQRRLLGSHVELLAEEDHTAPSRSAGRIQRRLLGSHVARVRWRARHIPEVKAESLNRRATHVVMERSARSLLTATVVRRRKACAKGQITKPAPPQSSTTSVPIRATREEALP
jgi:hypothetical protein